MMVQDAFVCDIDRSGDEELILLTWKKGKYGKDMPFWEKEKEKSYSQHIFIYDIDSNKYFDELTEKDKRLHYKNLDDKYKSLVKKYLLKEE